MKIQDIIEPARHLPFKIMITDPASKHAMEDVKNPFSGESCQLPRYAVAVYDVIKGAELLEDGKTMQKRINLVSKVFYGPVLRAVRLMKFLSVRKPGLRARKYWGQRVDAGRRCKRRPDMFRQLAP